MNRLIPVLLGCIAIVWAAPPAFAIRQMIEPAFLASECPLIVLGRIEKVVRSAPDNPHDLIWIRVEKTLLNELSDVEAGPGTLIPALMISTNKNPMTSTDFSFRLDQHGIWMLKLKPDEKFYLDEHPEQYQPADQLRALELKGAFRQKVVTLSKDGKPTRPYTKAEYLELPEKRRIESERAEAERDTREKSTRILAQSVLEGERFSPEKMKNKVMVRPHDDRLLLVQNKSETLGLTKEQHTALADYLLANDSSYYIRMNAAQWIEHRGNAGDASDSLVSALDDDAYGVRRAACSALTTTGDPDFLLQIRKLLEDPNSKVQVEAVKSLAALNDRDSVPAIREMFKSTDFDPGQSATMAGPMLELGDEDLWLEAAKIGLTSDNETSRTFIIRRASEVKSEKVVALLIMHLITEFQWASTHPTQDRVFVDMYRELDRRLGKDFGDDVITWVSWWNEHHKEYGGESIEIDQDTIGKLLRQYRQDKESL